jgi:hypothetical protein
MPIATSLCAALVLAAPALPADPFPATPPSVAVVVDAAATVPPALVTSVLAEAADIWSAAGVSVIWDRQATKSRGPDHTLRRDSIPATEDVAPRLVSPRGPLVSGLRVTIGDDRGRPENDPHVLPLGWIVFEAGSPLQEIYLSLSNAIQLLNTSDFVVGRVSTMTNRERYTLLGRAMGRALAHEIGHYLLASKAHTATGIMQAKRGAAELFSSSHRGFQVERDQRHTIEARLHALAARSNAAPPAGH